MNNEPFGNRLRAIFLLKSAEILSETLTFFSHGNIIYKVADMDGFIVFG